jgi:tetratricopeptide (TPR) repeat protein
MRRLRLGMTVVVLGVVTGAILAHAQKDPLDAAATAIDKKDFASAEKILTDYLQKHPKAATAMLLLGTARLDEKDFDGAIDELKELVKDEPKDWYGYIYLAQAYARKGDWKNFDKERALIKAARDSKARGIELVGDGDVIDILTVAGQQYTVKSYYKPVGPHQTHYVFLHIVDDGKLKDMLTCDSDDGDQAEFKREHPKEAAAGARRFSLDPWEVVNDQLVHGHILRFYDGEPTYEELRADVMKVLTANAQQENDKSVQ